VHSPRAAFSALVRCFAGGLDSVPINVDYFLSTSCIEKKTSHSAGKGCIFPSIFACVCVRRSCHESHCQRREGLLSAEAPERALWLPVVARERLSAEASHGVPRETEAVSDEELLGRVQARDSDAVVILFDRYSRLVLGIGYRVLRDPGEAEDLLQDMFLRLWEKASSFDASKGSARTWMVQVAYRRALDRRSRLSRRSFYTGTEIGQVANALQEPSGFEERILARLSGEQLHAAFAGLNDKQRATLELFFFENCSLHEIAERLGETFNNIRHHYYRGLENLRRTATALACRGEK
jgi:RNA polymerase sigma-70 factor, ECF subfamily